MIRGILKARWYIVVLWIAVAAGLFVMAPSMADLVREKGQITVPDGYSSSMADHMLKEVSKQGGSEEIGDTVLVFHHNEGLSSDNLADIEASIQLLKSKQQELSLTSVTSHFDQPELQDQLVSEDGKTLMVLLGGDWEGQSTSEVRDSLYAALKDNPVEHYLTSRHFIDEDVVASSEEGLKRTEVITVIFILVILFIVFRSAVAPFVPLLTVGISYLAAQSIVAFLVDGVDFPLSNFTQIFLVAVMFGIGTDYCILLISRFREELVKQPEDVWSAIIETYRTAGKTVLFSGLAVMVGFASIGFSTFVLYQSAAAVAVGVGVLLLALVTIVPFFMAVLGSKLFWPSKGTLEHKPSRMWAAAGRFSWKRPLITLLLLAVLIIPLLLTYDGLKSYNSLDEIGDGYDSVKAFNLIADGFGPGQSMPAKIVLKNELPMDTSEALAAIEKVNREIVKIDGIESIRSATRPAGEGLKELLVTEQVKQLDEGLGEGKDGIGQIREGLSTASAELSKSGPELSKAAAGVGTLVQGTDELKRGVTALNQGLKQIEHGIRQGSAGAGELKQAVEQAKQSAEQLAAAGKELLGGYQQLEGGISTFAEKYGEIEKGLVGISEGLGGMDHHLRKLAETYPELRQDEDYVTLQAMLSQLQQSTQPMALGMSELNAELTKVGVSLKQANQGLAQSLEGQTMLVGGLDQLVSGMEELRMGIKQAADGQGEIVSQVPGVIQGLGQISSGQKEIQQGFNQLDDQLGELTDGLDQSVAGLSELTGGLDSAQQYLNGLARASDETMAGWYIPGEVLANTDFQQVFDTYMSHDRKVATLDVVFTGNPYSTESIAKVDEIKAAVERAIKGTVLSDATYGISGVTGTFADLNEISAADYSRTVVLMLFGIGIILVVLLRSIIMPLYLILSLILTYFTSVAVAELIFVDMMGYGGISWAVPFFAFVILVALGVDYSIFLMDRFNEYRHLPVKDAMIHAMKNMGSVIISAAIILGGTFAAMLPSGVLSLIQIATIAITGLFLYAFAFMPFFVPVMIRTFGEANWWPFKQKEKGSVHNDMSL